MQASERFKIAKLDQQQQDIVLQRMGNLSEKEFKAQVPGLARELKVGTPAIWMFLHKQRKPVSRKELWALAEDSEPPKANRRSTSIHKNRLFLIIHPKMKIG